MRTKVRKAVLPTMGRQSDVYKYGEQKRQKESKAVEHGEARRPNGASSVRVYDGVRDAGDVERDGEMCPGPHSQYGLGGMAAMVIMDAG
jgi:hypothetical protein